MQLGISEILNLADKEKTKAGKISVLKQNDSTTLRKVLHGAYNPNVKWLLPPGPAPYTKGSEGVKRGSASSFVGMETSLYAEARKFYLFVEGGHPTLTQPQREKLFVQFLESIDPQDADLIVAMKDKKLPQKTITAKLVEEAFPGITTSAASL